MFKRSMIAIAVASLLTITSAGIADAYIGNRNSHKFHYDYCSSVDRMAERNKVYFETREDAINSGFVPCKRCHP